MPGRPCTICTHAKVDEINQALVPGSSIRAIASQYEVDRSALCRHMKKHIPAAIERAKEAAQTEQNKRDLSLTAQLHQLKNRVVTLVDKAEKTGNPKDAAPLIRELRAIIELLLRLTGELDTRPQVNIVMLPEWMALRGRIVRALEPYAEAKAAVVAAIENNGRN